MKRLVKVSAFNQSVSSFFDELERIAETRAPDNIRGSSDWRLKVPYTDEGPMYPFYNVRPPEDADVILGLRA